MVRFGLRPHPRSPYHKPQQLRSKMIPAAIAQAIALFVKGASMAIAVFVAGLRERDDKNGITK